MIFAMLFFSGCSSSKASLSAEKMESLHMLKTQLLTKDYRIAIDAVFPFNSAASSQVINSVFQNTGNSASRIDVSGDGNYIQSQDSIIKGSLPFFGEQRMSTGAYGSSQSGIEFENVPKDYIIEQQPKTYLPVITFETNQKDQSTESYLVRIVVFDNLNVDINIISSHRSVIRYDGKLTFTEIETINASAKESSSQ